MKHQRQLFRARSPVGGTLFDLLETRFRAVSETESEGLKRDAIGS
jgi:hypothetical protein